MYDVNGCFTNCIDNTTGWLRLSIKTIMNMKQLRNDSDTRKPNWGCTNPKSLRLFFSIIPTIYIKDILIFGSYLTVNTVR